MTPARLSWLMTRTTRSRPPWSLSTAALAAPTWTTCRCPHLRQGDNFSKHAKGSRQILFSVIHLTVCPTCWSLQLAARLDLVHDHPRFAPSSGLAGATGTFSPEQSSSFTPNLQDFSTILEPHDHFLSSQRPPKDEDFSFVLEEAVESLHIQQEVAAAFLWRPACCLECVQSYSLCFHTKLFWIVTLKDREVCEEEDCDKHALTPSSSFERTITVVKGNSSLGLYSFFTFLSLTRLPCLFYFLLSLHRSVNEFARPNLCAEFLRLCPTECHMNATFEAQWSKGFLFFIFLPSLNLKG